MASNYFCDDSVVADDEPNENGLFEELEGFGVPNADVVFGAPNGDDVFDEVLPPRLNVKVGFFCSPSFCVVLEGAACVVDDDEGALKPNAETEGVAPLVLDPNADFPKTFEDDEPVVLPKAEPDAFVDDAPPEEVDGVPKADVDVVAGGAPKGFGFE